MFKKGISFSFFKKNNDWILENSLFDFLPLSGHLVVNGLLIIDRNLIINDDNYQIKC